MRCSLPAVVIATLSAMAASGGDAGPDAYNFAASFSNGVGSGSQLLVFPSHAKKFSVFLPLSLRWVVYGPGGQSLYVVAFGRPGLQKIQFNPTRVSTLPGSEAFSDFHGFAVSRNEDKVLISGMRDVSPGTCDIFELSLPAGNLSLVRQRSDCATVLDLSPNGTEALISDVNKHLELLDLGQGTVKSIGACPSANPLAIEILDVETARRSTIKDSICSAGTDRAFGWISSDIKK